MSPAAIAVPRFTTNTASGSIVNNYSKESYLSSHSDSGDWNNMDSALDFDLLAEYLLEDGGMAGFDFMYVSLTSCVRPPSSSNSKRLILAFSINSSFGLQS